MYRTDKSYKHWRFNVLFIQYIFEQPSGAEKTPYTTRLLTRQIKRAKRFCDFKRTTKFLIAVKEKKYMFKSMAN